MEISLSFSPRSICCIRIEYAEKVTSKCKERNRLFEKNHSCELSKPRQENSPFNMYFNNFYLSIPFSTRILALSSHFVRPSSSVCRCNLLHFLSDKSCFHSCKLAESCGFCAVHVCWTIKYISHSLLHCHWQRQVALLSNRKLTTTANAWAYILKVYVWCVCDVYVMCMCMYLSHPETKP